MGFSIPFQHEYGYVRDEVKASHLITQCFEIATGFNVKQCSCL